MNILLVEDEPMLAMMLADMLGYSGHTVLGPAASVAAGIAEAEMQRPDLALVDIHLGMGGDGVELARRLHEDWSVPVLFLTAHDRSARAARDVAIGLVTKPYIPSFVLRCVEIVGEILAGKRLGDVPDGLELFQP